MCVPEILSTNSGNSDPFRFWMQGVFQVEMTRPSRGSIEVDVKRPRPKTRSRIAAAISSSCRTFPHSFSGLLVCKMSCSRSGVLQARSEEVDTMGRPIKKGNVDFAEVMLAKFSWQTFKTNQRLYLFGTNRSHQSVQGGLGSLVARFPNPAKDLQRG